MSSSKITIKDIIQSAKDSAALVGATDAHEIWGFAWSAWEAAVEAGQVADGEDAESLEEAFGDEFGEES